MAVINRKVGLVDFVRDDSDAVTGIRLNIDYQSQVSDGSGGTITHSGYTCTLPYWNELSTEAKTAAATLYAALKTLAEAATCPED